MWVKIDDAFYQHPKIMQAGPLGMALAVAGLCYSNRYLTDGFLPGAVIPSLCNFEHIMVETGGVKGIMSACDDVTGSVVAEWLVSVGVWEEVDGGYLIHDYHEYNPSADEVKRQRAVDAARKADARGKPGRRLDGEYISSQSQENVQPESARTPDGLLPESHGTRTRTPITPTEGAEAPPTKETKEKTKGVNLAPLYAAFKAAGQERPIIPTQEHKVAGDLLQQVGPDALVGIWMDIGKGVWPPDDKTHWMLNNRSFSTIAPRINNWIDFKNGRHVKLAAGKECKDWVD